MRFREFTLLARNLAEWTLIQAEIEAVDRAGAAGRFVDVYQHSVHLHVVVAEHDVQMNAVLIDVDESTGRARSIDRLNFRLD